MHSTLLSLHYVSWQESALATLTMYVCMYVCVCMYVLLSLCMEILANKSVRFQYTYIYYYNLFGYLLYAQT